jgi:hypothetical protein
VARVVALVPDLLFGSRVLSDLQAAGHEAVLVAKLGPEELEAADVAVLDLTADAAERLDAAAGAVAAPAVRTLAFYSHVEADVRALAEEAGVEVVVPRSRMAREGGALVTRLAAGG